MSAVPREKACMACAESKRKCDKQLPECQRCLDKDVDCVYPQRKRRRRDPVACISQAEQLPALENFPNADTLGSGLGFGDWDAMGAADLGISLSDVMIPYFPTPLAPDTSLSAQGVVLDGGDISSTPCPWFLKDETWDMQPCDQKTACVTFVELQPFIGAVDEMLQCWVKKGYNSFIHRRLYEKGMPACLQDAFTTLAAYVNRTPAVEEIILQISEKRSSALVHQSPSTDGDPQDILSQLARVQALFVYEFIQLFDGAVRPRASAERQLPTLRQWVLQMWEAVKLYRGEDNYSGHGPLQDTTSDFDREYDAASEMWQLWILTESVRRSHLIIDAITNTYEIMTKEWAECPGGVLFTARSGLWEAESPVKWFELSQTKSPLLVPSLRPGPLISQYAAEEVDEFAKMFWTFILGKDKIQCWIDKGNRTSRI